MKKISSIFIAAFLVYAPDLAQVLKGEEAQRWQKASSLAQEGKVTSALEEFKIVLDKKPEPWLFLQAGNILLRQSGMAQAEDLYLWGRRRMKQPQAFADRLADIYQSQQKYDRAVAEWCRLLPDQSDLVAAKLNEIAQQLGWKKTALLAESEIKSNSGDQGWYILGSLYLNAGEAGKAWRYFNRINDAKRLKMAVDRISAASLRLEQIAGILEDYLGRTEYRDVQAVERLGFLYLRLREHQKAAAVADRLMPLDRPRAIVLKAKVEMERSHPQEVIAILSAFAGEKERAPREGMDSLRVEARFMLASACLMIDNDVRAVEIWRSLAEDSAGVATNHRQRAAFWLGEYFLGVGEVDSALGYYRRTARIGLGGDLSNDALLRLLLISENRSATIEGLKIFGRALAERQRARRQKAEDLFIQVYRENPGTALADQALLELSLMHQDAAEWERAAESWGWLAEMAVDPILSCRAYYQQGLIHKYHLGRSERAARIWREAILKYPDYSWSDLMRQELGRE